MVNGCAPARSKIYAYNSKGKLIDSANASIHSAFKLTNLQRNETHRIVCYNGTMEIGCSATITGVTCFTTLIDFCASGIIWNCY
ncbi:MAG: hypothetical protein IPL53_19000 [Ignavibacteria bacterium]|nr:hypothetical protein [Ignavibacteria bacterium]